MYKSFSASRDLTFDIGCRGDQGYLHRLHCLGQAVHPVPIPAHLRPNKAWQRINVLWNHQPNDTQCHFLPYRVLHQYFPVLAASQDLEPDTSRDMHW